MDKKSKNLTITRTKAQAFKVGDRAKVIDSNENRIADKGVILAVEPGTNNFNTSYYSAG